MEKWYRTKFRRNLIDMHIPDTDPAYMASFDSAEYVRMLKTADVEVAYIYTTSCVGHTYFPTKIGHMHPGLHGRDIIGEIVDGCRRESILPVLYINYWSLWAYNEHPDWRCVRPDGKSSLDYMFGQPGRYGVCCPNSPYRQYVTGLVRELTERYDFEGLWVDMILWRAMCTCPHCRARFKAETGHDLPAAIDWRDPVWCLYVRKREEWIEEVFAELGDIIRAWKPDAPVICNSAYHPFTVMGEGESYPRLTTFISGDANMGPERSFESKLFNAKTANAPFEFLCSIMEPSLNEHSIMKSEEKLRVLFSHCLAHNGRNGFIDAIDPFGTLNPRVYERMQKVNRDLAVYEPWLTADVTFHADVAIYTNFMCAMDTDHNGIPFNTEAPLWPNSRHMQAAQGAAKVCMERHIPYTVITPNQLADLARYKVIVLPNVVAMSDAEVAAFTDYVRAGGKLWVSGETAQYDGHGGYCPAGRMAQTLGVELIGETREAITFLRPTEAAFGTLSDYTATHPLSYDGPQTLIRVREDAEVLAQLTLPLVDPADTTRFASAISNPPGRHTDYPSLIRRREGEGVVVYSAASLEGQALTERTNVFGEMLDTLAGRYIFEVDAPAMIEVILYEQESRYVLNVCNTVAPVVPAHDVTIRLRLPEAVGAITNAATGETVPCTKDADGLTMIIPKLHTFEMLLIEKN